MSCGGLSNVKEPDDEIRALCKQIELDLAKKLNKENIDIEVISYKTQVVAGTNFFVKIKVGDEYIHVRIFRPLPYTKAEPELSAIKLNQNKEDDITHF